MTAETLPDQFTACSDLESSNSVLLIRQEKRGKGGSVTSSVLQCMCQHPDSLCKLQSNGHGPKEPVQTEHLPS